MEGAERAIEHDLRWLGPRLGRGARPPERAPPAPPRGGRRRRAERTTRDGGRLAVGAGAARVRDRAQRRPAHVPLGDRPWTTPTFGITHVIRGNDHLPNAALQIAAVPGARRRAAAVYLHHALVRGEGGKLSKREGAARSRRCARTGYPPEAVVNLLGLVASSGPGDVCRCRSWSSGSTSTGWPAARWCSRAGPAAVALDRAPRRGWGATTWWRAVLPFCARTAPIRSGRGDGAGAARRPHAGRGGRAGRVRDSRRRLQHSLPELATIRGALSRAARRDAGARALVDELRSAGVPLREARLALTGRERRARAVGGAGRAAARRGDPEGGMRLRDSLTGELRELRAGRRTA